MQKVDGFKIGTAAASLEASYEFYFGKRFPRFASHDEASCFNCGGDFGSDPYWAESGFPHGHGQFRLECEKCRMSTWYDLEPERR